MIALRDRSIEGRDMGSARTDCARCDDSEDSGEDEGNEEEDGDEWAEEDGEDEEKDEEQRKQEKPTGEERKEFTIKNLFQQPSDKISNCSAQLVAESLQ